MNWGRMPPNWQCQWKCVNRRAAGSNRQFRTRSSKVFACQVMRNIVQGPPGCYECVAIISSQELDRDSTIKSTIWYRQQHLIAPMDPRVFPFWEQNPQVERNPPNLLWRAASESIGEGKQGEEKKALLSSSSKSTSIFSWLLNQSPSLSTRPNIVVARALHSTDSLWRSCRCFRL